MASFSRQQDSNSVKKFKLFLSIILCLILGWAGGLITESSVHSWYPKLVKPIGTPPNWAFPVVWTILYILMAIAFWLVMIAPTKQKITAYTIFGAQLFLNFMWSWFFFFLESPFLALIDITLLWFAIALTMIVFWRHSKIASYLLTPYLAWVTYATYLNLSIWLNN